MEDLKRLLLPAIIALLLHGALVSFKLPKQQKMAPVLQGNSIQVEITTFSPREVVVEKPSEPKKGEAPPEVIPAEQQIVPEKVAIQKSSTPQISIPETQKKVLVPVKQETVEVVKKKKVDTDLQNQPIKNPLTENSKAQTEIVDKSEFAKETDTKNSQEKESVAPVYQKAKPMYRKNKHPDYPRIARRRGYEGNILLNVLVDAKGLVTEITIKHSSGHSSLDRAAVQSIQGWIFTPAMERGRPVAMLVDVPVDFQLR